MKRSTYLAAFLFALAGGAAADVQAQICGHVPVVFTNARPGDVVLSSANGGIIKGLLSSIGQVNSHTGMVMTNPEFVTQIRHNTMTATAVKHVESGGIPRSFKATGSRSLRDGYPGMINQTAENAWGWHSNFEFNAANSVLLVGRSQHASKRAAGAAEFQRMVGWYRLFAYTDIHWSDYYDVDNNEGNMCSGSIAWSWVGRGEPGWMLSQYSADVRNRAAPTLRDLAYRSIMAADPGFVGTALNVFLNLAGADVRKPLAAAGSNQIVNCMAFNDCGNTGTRWRNGVGTGASLSPDDLRTLTGLNAAFGSTTFPYTTTTAISASGGYDYCL